MQRIKVSFDTWIQLLGMLGVIGGLVFVGLEMRQAQTIAIAGQVQQRATIQSGLFSTITERGEDIGKVILNQECFTTIRSSKKIKAG